MALGNLGTVSGNSFASGSLWLILADDQAYIPLVLKDCHGPCRGRFHQRCFLPEVPAAFHAKSGGVEGGGGNGLRDYFFPGNRKNANIKDKYDLPYGNYYPFSTIIGDSVDLIRHLNRSVLDPASNDHPIKHQLCSENSRLVSSTRGCCCFWY